MTDTPARVSLSDLPVDADGHAALEALVAAPVGHLVIIEGGVGDLAETAARAVARQLVGDAGGWDLHIAAPDSDRWTVREIEDRVAAPARLVAHTRNVIVVEAAERMDQPSADHLLRILEEPGGTSLFIFAVRDRATIGPTVRGRASTVVRVRPAANSVRIEAMVAAGADRAVAEQIVGWCGELTGLAALIANTKGTDALEAARVAFATTLEQGAGSPQQSADRIGAALETLAGLDTKAGPAVRARARGYARHVLAGWRNECVQVLREDSSHTAQIWVARAAGALDDADEDLRANSALVSVLAGLFAYVGLRNQAVWPQELAHARSGA